MDRMCLIAMLVAAAASHMRALGAERAAPQLETAAPLNARTAGERARELLRQEKFDEAEAEFRRVLSVNPYRWQLWYDLGFALHPQKRFDESQAAWAKARELGGARTGCLVNMACSASMVGRHEEAIDLIAQALDEGFTDMDVLRNDTDLAPIRDMPRFRSVAGIFPPDNLSRDERWRYDLDYLQRRMEQVHWDLYAKVSRTELGQAFQTLRRDVPSLSDARIMARLRKILALVGDGHTLLARVSSGPLMLPRYHIDLYVFSDGLLVRGAAAHYQDLIGGKVLSIGSLTADDALERLKAYCSVDNPMGYLDWASVLLRCPEILADMGATNGPNVQLQVRRPTGEVIARELEPAAFDAQTPAQFAYAHEAPGSITPLYLREPHKKFNLHFLPEHALLYARFAEVGDQPDETLAAFAKRLVDTINERSADYLALDMRDNTGGNTGLVLPLIHALIGCERINRLGHFYVIIGRKTFSAAMNTIDLIELHTEETFVGEPSGSSPNFVGESTMIQLPCSGLNVSCSDRYWQHVVSTDKRIWIAPHIAAPISSSDYLSDRDPALDAIIEDIRSNGGRPSTPTTMQ